MTTAAQLELRFSMPRDRFDITIDIAINLNEPVALFGPSGSGKTSVLRAIAGLERARQGRIAIGNEIWQDDASFLPAYQRRVGYVFQDARLFSHLSVTGNLDLAARAKSADTDFTRDEIIEKLNLGKLLDRDTGSLSGGETQRVAIARTLLTRPRLLLMDEPVSSLDTGARQETVEYIASLTGALRIPLIYVTHDAGEVARLAARTVLLKEGKVVAAGSTPEVFAQIDSLSPGTRTVSILAAEVSDESGGLAVLKIGRQLVHIPSSGAMVGESVQLRVFASDVVVAAKRIEDTSIRNVLAGRITEMRTLPDKTIEVLIDIEQQVLKAHITARARDELGLVADGQIYAMIKSVALSEVASRF